MKPGVEIMKPEILMQSEQFKIYKHKPKTNQISSRIFKSKLASDKLANVYDHLNKDVYERRLKE